MTIGVGAVQAGGTWLEPSDIRVEAGETLALKATVYRGTLGWVDDGPFYLYLRGDTFGAAVSEGYGGTATDVLLGDLDFGPAAQQLRVSADVTIPENTPPGEYWITACNDPCTTGLGDLVGAVVYVGIDPPAREEAQVALAAGADDTTSTAAGAVVVAPRSFSQRLALAPYPDRTADLSPIWVGISAALAGAVLLTALLSRQRA